MFKVSFGLKQHFSCVLQSRFISHPGISPPWKQNKYGNINHIQTHLPSLKYLTCPALNAADITHSDSKVTWHWKGYLKILHFDESGTLILPHMLGLYKTSVSVNILFISKEVHFITFHPDFYSHGQRSQ